MNQGHADGLRAGIQNLLSALNFACLPNRETPDHEIVQAAKKGYQAIQENTRHTMNIPGKDAAAWAANLQQVAKKALDLIGTGAYRAEIVEALVEKARALRLAQQDLFAIRVVQGV